MSNPEVAVLWRHDGVISYVIPASTLVNTFFASVLRHDPWLCHFVNELASVITPEVVTEIMGSKKAEISVALKAGLMSSGGDHRVDDKFVSRLHAGTDEHFPGMFYGTMHPTELSVLAGKITEVLEISEEMGMARDEQGKAQLDTVMCWPESAKKFVRPSEEMASLMTEEGNA